MQNPRFTSENKKNMWYYYIKREKKKKKDEDSHKIQNMVWHVAKISGARVMGLD